MSRIVAIGETTYDIVFKNETPIASKVGGSILNTAVSLGRLGQNICFVTRIGNDKVGDISIQFLKENFVMTDYIARYEGNSRLALAFLDEKNDATYQFYHPSTSANLNFPEIQQNDIIVFGSMQAINDEGRDQFIKFIKDASHKNATTIYDPNIRETDSLKLKKIRLKVEENLSYTTIAKGSVHDFQRIFSTTETDDIFEIVSKLGVKALFVTAAEQPVEFKTSKLKLKIAVQPVEVVSSIGAGDNFTSGVIFGLNRYGINASNIHSIESEVWESIIKTSIDFASEVCQSTENYISKPTISETE